MSDEEGFRPLKRGKRDGSDVVRENGPYLVDEDGRPTGSLRGRLLSGLGGGLRPSQG
jgi:hypothetical protein